MSAFVVSEAHIDALIHAGLALAGADLQLRPLRWLTSGEEVRTLTPATAQRTGTMLYAENTRSFNYRYTESCPPLPYTFRPMPFTPNPTVLLKVIRCYEYQACETDDWSFSETASFCRQLRIRLLRHIPEARHLTGQEHDSRLLPAIAALPGYQNSPWEITDIRQAAGILPPARERI